MKQQKQEAAAGDLSEAEMEMWIQKTGEAQYDMKLPLRQAIAHAWGLVMDSRKQGGG